jgi:hypothetical protein
MESIAQLKQITQGEKRATQSARYTRMRDVSVYVTWVLLHTPITANQVTAIGIAFGLLGVILVAMPSPSIGIAGCILLWIHILLDKVDGEVARYRKTVSLRGIFLDEIGHLVVQPLLFVALAVHVYGATGRIEALLLGYIPALQTGWARVLANLPFRIFSKKAVHLSIPALELSTDARAARAKRIEHASALLFKPLRVLHHFYWVVTLILVACLLDLLAPVPTVASWTYAFLLLAAAAQVMLFLRATALAYWSIEADVARVGGDARQALDARAAPARPDGHAAK